MFNTASCNEEAYGLDAGALSRADCSKKQAMMDTKFRCLSYDPAALVTKRKPWRGLKASTARSRQRDPTIKVGGALQARHHVHEGSKRGIGTGQNKQFGFGDSLPPSPKLFVLSQRSCWSLHAYYCYHVTPSCLKRLKKAGRPRNSRKLVNTGSER